MAWMDGVKWPFGVALEGSDDMVLRLHTHVHDPI